MTPLKVLVCNGTWMAPAVWFVDFMVTRTKGAMTCHVGSCGRERGSVSLFWTGLFATRPHQPLGPGCLGYTDFHLPQESPNVVSYALPSFVKDSECDGTSSSPAPAPWTPNEARSDEAREHRAVSGVTSSSSASGPARGSTILSRGT